LVKRTSKARLAARAILGGLTLPWENVHILQKVLVAQVAYQTLDNGISVLLTKTLATLLLTVRLSPKLF
jgi:hypothetical protein